MFHAKSIACVLSCFSCVWLCNSVDCSLLGTSVMGFSRQESWSGLPFPPPGDPPNPGIEPLSLTSPALAGGGGSGVEVLYHQCHLGSPGKSIMPLNLFHSSNWIPFWMEDNKRGQVWPHPCISYFSRHFSRWPRLILPSFLDTETFISFLESPAVQCGPAVKFSPRERAEVMSVTSSTCLRGNYFLRFALFARLFAER